MTESIESVRLGYSVGLRQYGVYVLSVLVKVKEFSLKFN